MRVDFLLAVFDFSTCGFDFLLVVFDFSTGGLDFLCVVFDFSTGVRFCCEGRLLYV